MILLFRVFGSDRSSIAQKRIKDTGWSIVYPNGKSGGHYGMPVLSSRESLLKYGQIDNL